MNSTKIPLVNEFANSCATTCQIRFHRSFLLAKTQTVFCSDRLQIAPSFVIPFTTFQKLTRLKRITASRENAGEVLYWRKLNWQSKAFACILMWWRAHYVGQVFNSFPLDMLFTSKCVSFWIGVESNPAKTSKTRRYTLLKPVLEQWKFYWVKMRRLQVYYKMDSERKRWPLLQHLLCTALALLLVLLVIIFVHIFRPSGELIGKFTVNLTYFCPLLWFLYFYSS